jgi:hypothetical protein
LSVRSNCVVPSSRSPAFPPEKKKTDNSQTLLLRIQAAWGTKPGRTAFPHLVGFLDFLFLHFFFFFLPRVKEKSKNRGLQPGNRSTSCCKEGKGKETGGVMRTPQGCKQRGKENK